MSRNTESHFGHIATKDVGRSTFKRDCNKWTTLNTGKLYPFHVEEVLPGDTAKVHVDTYIRMTTPIYPVMDNMWADIYYFFVPRRLTWEHFVNFMGENDTDEWTEEKEYVIPQLKAPTNGWNVKSLAAYLGARPLTEDISIDACYTRGYALIWNEWFRNQNVSEPCEISLGDADTNGSNGTDEVTDVQKGGCFARAVKYSDYFTRCLPAPQKGDDVFIPVGDLARVGTISETIKPYPDKFLNTVNNVKVATDVQYADRMTAGSETPSIPASESMGLYKTSAGTGALLPLSGTPSFGQANGIVPMNLYADLESATGATINALREALSIQRLLEMDARGGSRYIEQLAAHFGVNSPDARLQRPEYLGGKRIPINISQVVQNSSTDATSPQGNVAGMSLTIDNHDCFTKSFTEHGILYGLIVIRTEHSYAQGIPKYLSRKSRYDFYWPELANLGEQIVRNKEIFAQGTAEDEEVFGYQEAWAEYRYANNQVTGEFSPDYATPLTSWLYVDDYDTLPTLSDAWMKETDTNVARTLAIQNQDQFIANFHIDQTWARPMPVYSIPSLTGWN